MNFTEMSVILASSTYMIGQIVLGFFNFLLLIWPAIIGVVLGVGALFIIWRFLRSKIGGGGKLVDDGKEAFVRGGVWLVRDKKTGRILDE